MNKSRLLGALVMSMLAATTISPNIAAVTVFDDGGTHTIDYDINDGVQVLNGTTVNITTATITGHLGVSGDSTVNIDGATILGGAGVSGNFRMDSGVIEGTTFMSGGNNVSSSIYGGELSYLYASNLTEISIHGGQVSLDAASAVLTIDGGSVNIFSEFGGNVIDISGGSITGIHAQAGSYDITGGTFSGGILASDHDLVQMLIKGGTFNSAFEYDGRPDGVPRDYFIFYGDLSLSTPTLITEELDRKIYEATITGTLIDGTPISQNITCNDFIVNNDYPCGGLAIASTIPIPPALWLFGSGLLGLVGMARRKA